MEQITDLETYNSRMQKSLLDKIYFLDKVDSTVFVDYGCADGSMLKLTEQIFPDYDLYGFDNDTKMIEEANKNNSGVLFTTDWAEIEKELEKHRNNGKKTTLVLSSVIHEFYSYMSYDEFHAFWNNVFKLGFDYICIRDMMVNRKTSRPSDPLMETRIRQLYDADRISEWESTWGGLHENWSLIHFLLTYRYTENWKRELKENYLPINKEDFLNMISFDYVPIYTEHYTLPFIRQQSKKDFGIELQDRTHLKLILELNN